VLSPTSDFKTYLASVKEVKAVDPLTVHMTTDGPNPILPDQLTNIFIMSRAWCEKHNVTKPQSFKDKEETHAVRNAMGTGPFMVKQRDPDIKTVLVKNPAYWGKDQFPNYPDEIVYTPIKEPATRVAALISGQLDFVLDVQLQDVARVKQTAGLKTLETAQIRSIFLGLDVGSPELKYSDVKGKNPFADARVREAMYKAIDINAIKTKVMRNFAAPAGIITANGVAGWTRDLDARQPFDLAGAKKLMADAGYPNGFKVTLDCPNDRYNNDEAICQAAVGMLSQIGIQIDLQARSKTLHFPKLQKKDSSFYLLGWGVPTLDALYSFQSLLATRNGAQGDGIWNYGRYSNPRMDELVERMKSQSGEPRMEAIREALRIYREDVPHIPLHHQMIPWAMRSNVNIPHAANNQPYFRWMVVN
jgi:peptide/nickel transport system substrate-binding protein